MKALGGLTSTAASAGSAVSTIPEWHVSDS